VKKSIFITGASSGIGRALSVEMASRGYDLALTARRHELLEQVRDTVLSQFPDRTVEIRALDITDYEAIPQVLNEMIDAMNGIDIVFVNAGIGLAGKIGHGKLESAIRTLETNLIGAIATVDAAVACFMEQGKGHVVGVSSVTAARGFPGLSAYTASKAGLSAYLETLRVEVYRKNIDVTVLYPGYIDTPLNDMLPNRPFVISAEKGASIIGRLIEKKVKSSTVPVFPWNLIGPLLRLLPAGIIYRMG